MDKFRKKDSHYFMRLMAKKILHINYCKVEKTVIEKTEKFMLIGQNIPGHHCINILPQMSNGAEKCSKEEFMGVLITVLTEMELLEILK